MNLLPLMIILAGMVLMLGLGMLAFSGPSAARASNRRMISVRERHAGAASATAMEAQVRKIAAGRQTQMDLTFAKVLPNPALLQKRLSMTGRNWTVGKYGVATVGLAVVVAAALLIKGAPAVLALFVGLFVGVGVPHMAVGFFINRRVGQFTAKFPDAIELLVRGLRSGLPITETMGVVGQEVPGPVGEEFRSVSDKMKIGKTMDQALQETSDRLGTPEFQFFVITIAIQRETGGNLAETLANLANVLRVRSQMKLKVKAMSSESKASAYIIGSLPFIVFGLIYYISPQYMGSFFIDERLIVAGGGGMVWMSIGAFIMRQMINFEI